MLRRSLQKGSDDEIHHPAAVVWTERQQWLVEAGTKPPLLVIVHSCIREPPEEFFGFAGQVIGRDACALERAVVP